MVGICHGGNVPVSHDDDPKTTLNDKIDYVLFSFKILPTELRAMSEKNQSGRFLNRMPTTKS